MKVVCSVFVVWGVGGAFVFLLEPLKSNVWRVDWLFELSFLLRMIFSLRLLKVSLEVVIWLIFDWLVCTVLYSSSLLSLGIILCLLLFLLLICFYFFIWVYLLGVSIVNFVYVAICLYMSCWFMRIYFCSFDVWEARFFRCLIFGSNAVLW